MYAWSKREISLTCLFERLDEAQDWMMIAVLFACFPDTKDACKFHVDMVGGIFEWKFLEFEPDLFDKTFTAIKDRSGAVIDIVALPPFRSTTS